MKQLLCPVCGSAKLEKKGNTLFCPYCEGSFVENFLEEAEKIATSLEEAKQEKLANARRNLYLAAKEENIDTKKIQRWAAEVKKYYPEDFCACFFEAASDEDPRVLNVFLDTLDNETIQHRAVFLNGILNYLIRSFEKRNIISVKNFTDRAHYLGRITGGELEAFNTNIEEETKKIDAGVYQPELPRDVFVAYSSKDMAEVNELVDYLEGEGLKCFVALRNLRHGKGAKEHYQKYLEMAMRNCWALVFVSTHNSRDFSCDAMKPDGELSYIRNNLPEMYRVEYRPKSDNGKTPGGPKIFLKDFFKDLEYARTLEDVLQRLVDHRYGLDKPTPAPKVTGTGKLYFCPDCGTPNDESERVCTKCGSPAVSFITREEYQRRAAERKAAEEKRAKEEAERKAVAAKAEAERLAAKKWTKEELEQKRKQFLADSEIKDGILIKYNGEDADVVIPDSVTSIGSHAFKNCEILTSIVIPDSVTSIGDYAFEYCKKLTSIVIPDSVTSIGEFAFGNCILLSSIAIPNGVTSIERGAFEYCKALTSVSIPNSVKSIGEGAFHCCEALSNIAIPDSVTKIERTAFFLCKKLTSITIPSSVISIGSGVFRGSGLRSITIPDSVTSIGWRAFGGSGRLEHIIVAEGNKVYRSEQDCLIEIETNKLILGCQNSKIPDSVTSIEAYAFDDCRGLRMITIPNSVTSIGREAFINCRGLTSITILNSMTSIGSGAFEWCSGLEHIIVKDGNKVYRSEQDCLIEIETNTLILGCKNSKIPDSVTSIECEAFSGCIGLTSISIPDSVTSIGDWAFSSCTGLTSIMIPNSVTSIGDWAFSSCTGLTSITIPDSVTLIGDSAFEGCSGLTSIIIPNSVTSIGEHAFYGCSGLKYVTIPKRFEGTLKDIFGDDYKKIEFKFV